jgi:cyclase
LLESSRARIAALIERGDSEEEALARKPFAELEKKWGWSFGPGDRFATLIYRSLGDLRARPAHHPARHRR